MLWWVLLTVLLALTLGVQAAVGGNVSTMVVATVNTTARGVCLALALFGPSVDWLAHLPCVCVHVCVCVAT